MNINVSLGLYNTYKLEGYRPVLGIKISYDIRPNGRKKFK